MKKEKKVVVIEKAVEVAGTKREKMMDDGVHSIHLSACCTPPFHPKSRITVSGQGEESKENIKLCSVKPPTNPHPTHRLSVFPTFHSSSSLSFSSDSAIFDWAFVILPNDLWIDIKKGESLVITNFVILREADDSHLMILAEIFFGVKLDGSPK